MFKQVNLSKQAAATLFTLTLLGGGVAKADPVSGLNTFVAGQPATAASVNDNFTEVQNSVNDNDTRITTNAGNIGTNTTNVGDNFALINSLDDRVTEIESGTSNLDFSSYGTPFSADGATKNVTVLVRNDPGGNTIYTVRSRYANSTEQISIDGVLTVRPFIANYAGVGTDSSGNLSWVSNYIEAYSQADFSGIYNIEESTYDINTLTKTVTDDTLSETFICGDTGSGSGNQQICVGHGTVNQTGVFSYLYDWNRHQALGGPFTFNGITYPDVRMESYTGAQLQFRIRAKDIGMVYRRQRNSNGVTNTDIAIYYQVNGVSEGSLAGTPFEPGVGPLDGLFF